MTGSLKLVHPGEKGGLPTWESCVTQKRKRAQCRTRKEAEKWHNERVAAALSGVLETRRERIARERAEREARERNSISSIVDAWIVRHGQSLQAGTRQRYVGLAAQIKNIIGDVALTEFGRRDASAFFAKLAEMGGVRGRPLSRSSVHQARVLLSQALEEAVTFGLVKSNVVRGIKIAGAAAAERKPPNNDDVRRLLAAAIALFESGEPSADADVAIPIFLAATCGMRRGEILALRWEALDLERGSLDVVASLEEVGATIRIKSPKTARSRRTLALPAVAVTALRLHRQRQRAWAMLCGPGYDREADLVNPGPDGRPWRPSGFTDRYASYARRIGVPGTFHDLRHSHGSALVAYGVDARTVSNRLGHASPAFTMSRYVHSGSDSDRRAAASFDDLLRGPESKAANEAAS